MDHVFKAMWCTEVACVWQCGVAKPQSGRRRFRSLRAGSGGGKYHTARNNGMAESPLFGGHVLWCMGIVVGCICGVIGTWNVG